jgi:Holliday junction resolvase RusA-like endonuclease
MVSFFIPGEPVAFARAGANGAQRFTPKRQRDFMALVKLAACRSMVAQALMTGPVALNIRASYVPPVSWSKKKTAGATWRAARPDADNLAKIIADALNTIVYADDAQIASLTVRKIYGPVAGVSVSVVCLEDADFSDFTNSTIADASDRGGAVEGALQGGALHSAA